MESADRVNPGWRTVAILFHPRRTWDHLAAGSAEPRALLTRYVAPLAAIPAVCRALGASIFAFNIANVGVRQTSLGLALEAVAAYAATLVTVWLLARCIAWLAPAFGGVSDHARALALAAYSGTALWLAGVFHLYPSLGIPVSILAALYSGYTLYLGLTPMTGSPPERRLTFFAVILIVLLGIGGVAGMFVSTAAELGGPLSVHAPVGGPQPSAQLSR